MPCKQWKKSIKGVDDIELGIPRASPLIYHCTAPESGKAGGIVFVIPDFNDEADGEVFNALRARLANEYGLLAVTVEYHCYRSRLQDGAQLDLSEEEFSALRKICADHYVALLDRNALIPALKQLQEPYEFEFRVIPANNDYQNFGVMQALDHLAVLHDLMQDDAACSFDSRNIMAMGAGHGGYLAHLIAKFAPNALRAVFDADSRTSLPPSYLFGEQAGSDVPYYYHLNKIRISPVINTRWRQEASGDAAFTKDRAEIRDVALASHIGSMQHASQKTARDHCHYRLMTSSVCDASIAAQKLRQTTLLRQSGFDAEIRQQQPAQGGKAAAETQPLRELASMFEACYPALPALAEHPAAWQSRVSYLSGELLYCIDFEQFGCHAMVVPVERERKQFMRY